MLNNVKLQAMKAVRFTGRLFELIYVFVIAGVAGLCNYNVLTT